MSVKRAIIPAAGLGTRFEPASKYVAKELFPICDRPAIEWVIKEALQSGIERVGVIVSQRKQTLIEFLLSRFHDKVDLIFQNEAKGLGHAVYQANTYANGGPLAILLGDNVVNSFVPSLKKLINVYDTTRHSVIGTVDVPNEDVHKYGIVNYRSLKGGVMGVISLVEKPKFEDAPSNQAIMGRYVVTPNIFKCLENTPPGVNNEIQLTDALSLLLKHNPIFAVKLDGKVYDIGNPLGYAQANMEITSECYRRGLK